MGETTQRFTLAWESQGHDVVQAEADRVDKALDAVAQQVGDVTQATNKGKGSLDAYSQEMEDVQRRADRAGDALDEMARSATRADHASDELGGGLGGVNDQVREGLSGFDEMGGRLGQVTNALNLLSGVALVGLVEGLTAGITKIYEMTEAGARAKAVEEARATAISAVVEFLKQQKSITEQTTAATWGLINAQTAQTLSSEKLSTVITEQYDLQAEFGELVIDIGRRRAAGEREYDFGVTGRIRTQLGHQIQRYETMRDKLVELDKVRAEEQARLIAINNTLNAATGALDKSATTFDEHTASVQANTAALQDQQQAGQALLDFWSELEVEAAMAEAFAPDPATFDFDALGQALADGINEGLDRIGSIGEALGIGDVEPEFGEVFAMFDSLAEHAGTARSVLGDISSTVGLMGQMASLESSNSVQKAKNRARDAKGEKERLAAEKAVLAAERAAEKERRRFQAADFALKAADNVGAAIEEAGKAAGSYPDPVGIAMHTFAALKHGAAAAFYGSGAVSAASAPSSVGGGSGLGGTPSAPTPADNPRREQSGSSSITNIILNGVMADGRSVRTALVDGLNTVGDGQLPVEEGS